MKNLYLLLCLWLLSIYANSQTITVADVPTTICANEAFSLSYSSSFAGYSVSNIFSAELSDESGSFAFPTTIGFITSDALSGTIYVWIPDNTFYGAGYRIRVVSSEFFFAFSPDNGANININCTTRDYYWIGGTGNWSDLSHWEYSVDGFNFFAATQLPQSTDNVNFDDTTFPTGGQVTVDVPATCNDFFWDPISAANNPVIWGNASNGLTVHGDFDLSPGVYRDLYYIYFNSTKHYISINLADNLVQFDPGTTWWKGGYLVIQSSGSYDLSSPLAAESLSVNGGTFYTNDYQLDLNTQVYMNSGALDIGASTINSRMFSIWGGTFTEGTSSIFLKSDTNGNPPFLQGTAIYNNVTIQSGECTILGSNTFEGLSVLQGAGLLLGQGSNQTVNTDFTAAGARSGIINIHSDTPGIQAQLTVLGTQTIDYVAVQDIDASVGTLLNATNAVDLGNNLNWTFTALQPLEFYWVNGGGTWSDLTHWRTSTDAGVTLLAVTEGPGQFDNVHFTSSSFPTGGTITIDQDTKITSMIWEPGSGAVAPTITSSSPTKLTIFGDLTMDTGVNRQINQLVFNSIGGINLINMADNSNPSGYMDFRGGGSWDLQSDLDLAGGSMNIYDGTLNTNNYSITTWSIGVYDNTAVLNLGSSNISITHDLSNWAPNPALPVINTGTSTITFDYQWGASEIRGPCQLYNVVAARELNIQGNNNITNLTVSPGATCRLFAGSTQTVTGTLILTGNRSTPVTIESFDSGSPGTGTFQVTGATVTADFVNLANNTIDNGLPTTDVPATNGVDNGGNSGWAISPIVPLEYYWTGGAGNWSDLAHWQTSPDGGTSFVSATDVPGPVDNVSFTNASFPSGGTLWIDSDAHCHNMTWTTGSGTFFPVLQENWPATLTIHGSLVLDDGVTRNLNDLIFDSENTGNTIDLADNLYNWGTITFNGSGSWTLMSPLSSAYLTINSGVFNSNGQPINLDNRFWVGDDPAGPTVNLAASDIYLNSLYYGGNNAIFNAQTSTFYFDGTVNPSSMDGSNTGLGLNNAVIDGEVDIHKLFSFQTLTLNAGAHLDLESGVTQTITGSLTAIGNRSQIIEIESLTPGSSATIAVGSALVDVQFASISDNIISGASIPYAASSSIDNGGNTGWDFSVSPLVPLEYYWIGGTGNWTDVTHWATTDGGTTLQPFPPGLVDNVNFTSNSFPSGGTVTLDQSVTCTNMTWNDGSFNPTIYGDNQNSLTISGNLTIVPGINRNVTNIIFDSNKTGNQLSFGDNRYEVSNITFQGSGDWNLIGELDASNLTLKGGTLNTNGMQLTVENNFTIDDGNPGFDLGTSSISSQWVSNWNYSGTVTANVGTSTISIKDNGGLQGNNMGFNNVIVEGNADFWNTNSFNNLTILPGGVLRLNSGNTQTVTSLTANGTNDQPVTIKSIQDGSTSSISQATGTVDANNIILKDNVATGGAIFNATEAYDKGNNTGWNITAKVGQNYYWMANSGNWSDRNNWSLTDGANVIPATAPGPADNVFFTINGLTSGGTVTLDQPAQCNDMTWSPGITGATIFGDFANSLTIHGSLTMANGIQRDVSQTFFDSDATGNTITMADNLNNGNTTFTFNGTGDWTLQDPMDVASMNVQGGTLLTNDQGITADHIGLWAGSGTPGTLDLGASLVNTRNMDGGSSGTLVAGTSKIILADNFSVYDSWTFNDVEIDGKGSFYGDNAFNTLTILPGSDVKFNQGGTQSMTQLVAVGLRSRPIRIRSTTDGTQATILQSSGVVAGEYLILQDNNALGSAAFSATNTINDGNVTGWNITPITPITFYWVGGSGKWSEYTTHWVNADGGTNFYGFSPGPKDNVMFTANSFPAGGTLTLDNPVWVTDMDWTGTTTAVTISGFDAGNSNSLKISGSLTLVNGITRDLDELTFNSDQSGNILTFADNLQNFNNIKFNGSGDWTLADGLEAGVITFENGVFNTNGNPVTADVIYLQNGSPITNWGSSTVTLQYLYNYISGGAGFNSGTSTFHFDQPSFNFINGDSRFYIALVDGDMTITSGNNIFFNFTLNTMSELTIMDDQAFNSLTVQSGSTVSLGDGTTQTVSAALDLMGTVDEPIIINSTTDGGTGTFSVPPTGAVTADYVHLKDNSAVGGASFAATNSSDFGNVTGWTGLLTGQSITFDPLHDQPLTAGTFSVNATASSGLGVTYTVSQGSATLSGNTVTPTAAGLIGIKAFQPGDATYGNAVPEEQFIHINSTSEPNELGNMKEAAMVIGQPDELTNDQIYTDTSTPWARQAIVSKDGKLLVCNGTRVLIWNKMPSVATTPADVVIGHADFTTDIENSVTSSTFSGSALSISLTSTIPQQLIVTDYKRVLIWPDIPSTNGASAIVVVGQDDFNSTATGTGANRFAGNGVMACIAFDPGTASDQLIVSDVGNSRVLIFNSIPTINGASADLVLGQPDFNSNGTGSGPDEMSFPFYPSVSPDGKLLVGDEGNNRILVFNTLPVNSGTPADMVLGQPDFGMSDPGLGPTRFSNPSHASVSRSGKLAISDYVNNRILIYNQFPVDNTVAPDYVLGQPSDISADKNYGGLSGRSMYFAETATWDASENLLVADRGNNRVLIYGAADLTPPMPSNTNMVTTYISGSGMTATADLSDRSGLADVSIFYRFISSPNQTYTQVTLPPDASSSSTYSFNLNVIDQASEPVGLDYYLEATDGVGNVFSNSSSPTLANISYSGLPITNFGVGSSTSNYRIFTVPLNLQTSDAKFVFDEIYAGNYDDTKMRLFSYAGGMATTFDEYGSGFINLDIGKGYFGLAATSTSVNSGQGTTVTYLNYDLVDGWNLIGNPYNFTLLWSDVEAASGFSSAEVQGPQTYTGSYTNVTSLAPGEGAFVLNTTGGNLNIVFPPTNNSGGRITDAPTNTNDLSHDSWEVRFMGITNTGDTIQLGAAGMEPDALQSRDKYDRAIPPLFSGAKAIIFYHPEYFVSTFNKDIRPTGPEQMWSFSFTGQEYESSKQQVCWDNSYFGDLSPDLLLVDKTHYRVIDMKTRKAYVFEHHGTTQFELYFGDNAYNSAYPKQVKVEGPYPNPFTSNMTLNLGLPLSNKAYKVKIVVYNSMGRIISTLTDSNLEGGYHSITWDGKDEYDHEVAEGLYAFKTVVEGMEKITVSGTVIKQ